MEEAIEEEKELEEANGMASGAVQGASGSTWKGLDTEKANKDEKKRSKSKIKQALVGEESIIEEIANYLLKTSLMGVK